MPKHVITPEIQAQFCAVLTFGCSQRAAAEMADVSESTVRNALRRDKEFRHRVRTAMYKRELIPLRHLQAAGEKSWRAAAWLLERLNPDVFGKRKPREMSPHEVAAVVRQLVGVITDAITDPEKQQEVLHRMKETVDQIAGENPNDDSWLVGLS